MRKIVLIILSLVVIVLQFRVTVLAKTWEEVKIEAQDTIHQAANAVRAGNWRLTKKYAQELIDKYPDMDFGYLFMGISYDDRGKHKKAIEYYEKALELHPNDSDTYQNIGYAYLRMKDYENSIKYLKKAIELNPKCQYASEQLQQAYRGYKLKSIREVPTVKIDENHFMIRREDIVRTPYIYDGKSIVDKEVAEPLSKEIANIIKKQQSCKYISVESSDIKEDIYFEGTSWADATGSWTEYWEFFNACGVPIVATIRFEYNKGIIKGYYDSKGFKRTGRYEYKSN
jgi:tetratricopeptide (TPR) repeat protein